MHRRPGRCYRTEMDISGSSGWLTDVATSLGDRFGSRLALIRDGDSVRWTFEGHAALVSLRAGAGTLDATFVEPPAFDAAAATDVRCLYRPASGVPYALSAAGCFRMVDDMAAFFAGTREPLFTFVGAAA
jgi:hypothetical protein